MLRSRNDPALRALDYEGSTEWTVFETLFNRRKQKMAVTKKKMSAFESVFNGHVNNANKRARKVLADHFPEQLAEVELKEKEGNGIMVILNSEPTMATMAYVVLVTMFVNE